MRIRALDQNGDMQFGQGSGNFLVNSPQGVLQCILTALKLFQGEWFLNTSSGMPWNTQVLGVGTQPLYDNAIQACIRGVTGVSGIGSYFSSLNTSTRALTISAAVQTAYGSVDLSTTLQFAPPATGGFGVGYFGFMPLFGE